jgi:hypothetical protein
VEWALGRHSHNMAARFAKAAEHWAASEDQTEPRPAASSGVLDSSEPEGSPPVHI